MSGTLKIDNLSLGDSVTATHNFTLKTNGDGTAVLARGNLGATTQDILTIAADGKVTSEQVYVPAGTGAVATTVQTKLRESVSVKDFGAVGDGVADDTAAFVAAAATGKPLWLPYGDFVISSPVTISSHIIGSGADDGQTTITLTGTGQLIVGDWHAKWDGFFIRSAVNNKKFISVPGISYFSFTNFRAEKIGAATGQVAIEFDTTTASVYFANIDNFKIKVDYPFNITGNSTQVFNANKIGTVATGYYQDFLSAISIGGVLACDANAFAGYFEAGTNAVTHTAGTMRQNRFSFVLDAVTRAYNTSVTVTDPNVWEILDGGFTTAGTYPQNQILVGPPATKVRATNSTADSIPNASATILKFDGELYDTLSEFANGSGIFTAENAGYYHVAASALSASVAWDAGERWEIRVYKNGVEYAKGEWNVADATTTCQRSSQVSTTVYLNGTTDTLDVRVIHNQGSTVLLESSPTGNYIDIFRIP